MRVDEKQGCLGDVTSGADRSRGDWLGVMRDARQAMGLNGRQWEGQGCWIVVVHYTSQRTPCASIRKTNREMMAVYFQYRVEYTKIHCAEEVLILAVYIVTTRFIVL